MRRYLFTVLRVVLILAGVGYIAWVVQWNDEMVVPAGGSVAVLRPGMLTLLRDASPGWLLAGLLLVSVVWPLQAWRWWLLIRCRGLEVSFLSVLKLVMVGLFFNFCVPLGSNGGDVVKAYGAAKTMTAPGSKSTMVISVLLDRVMGMVALLVLAGSRGAVHAGGPDGPTGGGDLLDGAGGAGRHRGGVRDTADAAVARLRGARKAAGGAEA